MRTRYFAHVSYSAPSSPTIHTQYKYWGGGEVPIPHPNLHVYLGLGCPPLHPCSPYSAIHHPNHPHLKVNLGLGRTLHAVKLDEDAHSLLLLVPRGGHLIGRE